MNGIRTNKKKASVGKAPVAGTVCHVSVERLLGPRLGCEPTGGMAETHVGPGGSGGGPHGFGRRVGRGGGLFLAG